MIELTDCSSQGFYLMDSW